MKMRKEEMLHCQITDFTELASWESKFGDIIQISSQLEWFQLVPGRCDIG